MGTTGAHAKVLNDAEHTVRTAKKEFNKTLDYSVDSLDDLYAFIEYVKRHFAKLASEGKLSEQTLQRASISIGAYLGEVLRRKYGGTWKNKNDKQNVLIINEWEISPSLYIFERLTEKADYSLDKYWFDIDQMVRSQEKTRTNAQKETSNNNRKNRILIIAGCLGITALGLVIAIGMSIYSSIRTTNEFNAKLNTFMEEAEKLGVMTETGVSYQDFKTQYYEVKTTYKLIDSWPRSYQDRKNMFDEAIEGWGYALDVWEFKLGLTQVLWINSDIEKYLGVETTYVDDDVIISELMTKARMYFNAGKAGLR